MILDKNVAYMRVLFDCSISLRRFGNGFLRPDTVDKLYKEC